METDPVGTGCDRVCGRKGQCRDALCCAEAALDGAELEGLQSTRILQLEQKANHRPVPPHRGGGRAPRAPHPAHAQLRGTAQGRGSTHLHGEQPLLIGEDAVGVDVPLEPGESR